MFQPKDIDWLIGYKNKEAYLLSTRVLSHSAMSNSLQPSGL